MSKRYPAIIILFLLLAVIISLSVVDAAAIGSNQAVGDYIPSAPPTATPASTGTPIPATVRSEAPSLWMPPGVLDDFNRSVLGSNWSGNTAGYAITSDELRVISAGEQDIYWNVSPFGVGQVITITLSAIDNTASEIGLILKSQNIVDDQPPMINVLYSPVGGYVQVWTYTQSQGWLQRGSEITVSFSNGDQFGAHARANGQVEVYKNGVLIGWRDVTDWPFYPFDGYIGLFNIDVGTTSLDNFSGGTTDNAPTPTPPPPPCTDPLTCNPVSSISARWRCNTLDCPPNTSDWTGAVIAWPWYTAFESNNRVNLNSRTIYPHAGNPDTPLYAYMKDWADGCEITAVSGTVVIIEWQRGSEIWAATTLQPGDTYTVSLASPQNGVLIEGLDEVLDEFWVSLSNCIPVLPNRSFGETDVMQGASPGNHGNLLYAQQSSLGGYGAVQSISIYVENQNPNGQLRLGIYDDNGGQPGTLLAETAPFTPVNGWNTEDLLAQPNLVPGTYWLAFVPENNSLRFAQVTGTGVNWRGSHTFAALPSSFPASPMSQTVKYSIYATMIQSPLAVSLESLDSRQAPTFFFLVTAIMLSSIFVTIVLLIVARKRYQLNR